MAESIGRSELDAAPALVQVVVKVVRAGRPLTRMRTADWREVAIVTTWLEPSWRLGLEPAGLIFESALDAARRELDERVQRGLVAGTKRGYFSVAVAVAGGPLPAMRRRGRPPILATMPAVVERHRPSRLNWRPEAVFQRYLLHLSNQLGKSDAEALALAHRLNQRGLYRKALRAATSKRRRATSNN